MIEISMEQLCVQKPCFQRSIVVLLGKPRNRFYEAVM